MSLAMVAGYTNMIYGLKERAGAEQEGKEARVLVGRDAGCESRRFCACKCAKSFLNIFPTIFAELCAAVDPPQAPHKPPPRAYIVHYKQEVYLRVEKFPNGTRGAGKVYTFL